MEVHQFAVHSVEHFEVHLHHLKILAKKDVMRSRCVFHSSQIHFPIYFDYPKKLGGLLLLSRAFQVLDDQRDFILVVFKLFVRWEPINNFGHKAFDCLVGEK